MLTVGASAAQAGLCFQQCHPSRVRRGCLCCAVPVAGWTAASLHCCVTPQHLSAPTALQQCVSVAVQVSIWPSCTHWGLVVTGSPKGSITQRCEAGCSVSLANSQGQGCCTASRNALWSCFTPHCQQNFVGFVSAAHGLYLLSAPWSMTVDGFLLYMLSGISWSALVSSTSSPTDYKDCTWLSSWCSAVSAVQKQSCGTCLCMAGDKHSSRDGR